MKWILVFFAAWNLAGALLRAFRILLERFPLTRRLYPNRDMRPLDGSSDLELSPAAKASYRTAAEKLSRMASIPVPELLWSPKNAMLAGTRGWRRHELHLSRSILHHAREEELLAVVAHELGHIHYRHFAVLRLAEIFGALVYARVVFAIWNTSLPWYWYLGLWSLLDFSFSLFRLAAGSMTELMADHYAAHKLGMAEELSRGLIRAQCFNGATEFTQITHFYPTVKLRVRLLSRYARAAGPAD
ncbi:MAG: Peptidase family [Bryobacterales bacterium]|nr:Peptidase family [Bryobacterales bacterium]